MIRLIAALAMQRNSRKPNTSVAVMTVTDEATAGSTPILFSSSGTPAPTAPAIAMFPIVVSHSSAGSFLWSRNGSRSRGRKRLPVGMPCLVAPPQ